MTKIERHQSQNRVIKAGIGFALLSQYIWLLPVPDGKFICMVIAGCCAAVALVMKFTELIRG